MGFSVTDSEKRKGFLKQQHEALIDIYPGMTRKERREWVKANVPHKEPQSIDEAILGEYYSMEGREK